MEQEFIEKRKDSRAPLKILVDYRSKDLFRSDYASNISGGGIFIQTTNPLPIGTILELQLAFPDIPRLIKITGKVLWVREYGKEEIAVPGMGIQFLDLKREDKAFIQMLVKGLL